MPANDNELFEALFEALELEVDAVIGLLGCHGGNIEPRSTRVNNVRGGDSMPKARATARNAHVTPTSATPSLDYDRLRDHLAGAGAVVAPAELHGGVCGALCAGGTPAANRWLTDCLD